MPFRNLSIKFLLFISLFFISLNSYGQSPFSSTSNTVLSESLAFKVSSEKSTNKGQFERIIIEVEEGYYLYKDKILLYSNNNIIPTPNIPYSIVNDEFYGEVNAVKNSFSIVLNEKNDHYLQIQGCSPAHNMCYQPQYFLISYDSFEDSTSVIPIEEYEFTENTSTNTDTLSEGDESSSLLDRVYEANIFIKILIFILIGVGISFTPCVLPMIPIISSMILKESKKEKSNPYKISFAYVLGSSTLYGLIGFITTLGFFGIQSYIQNVWFIVISSLILFVFAFLMIDKINLYNIKGISSINNFANNKMNKLNFNFKNSFVIGFLSSMMLSPCVAAPLGVILLYTTTLTNPFISFIYLFSFGLGAGLILIFSGSLIKKINPSKFVFVKYIISSLILIIAIFLISRILNSNLIIFTLYSLSIFYIIYLYCEDFNKAKFRPLILPLFALSIILFSFSYDNSEITTNNLENNIYIENIDDIPDCENFIVKVYADWCVYCQDMEENIFSNPIDNFNVYTLDITKINSEKRKVLEEYSAISAPAIIVFKDGEYLKTHNGHLTKDELEKLLYN